MARFSAAILAAAALVGAGSGSDCDGGSMVFAPVAGGNALAMGVSDTARRFRMSWGYFKRRNEVP